MKSWPTFLSLFLFSIPAAADVITQPDGTVIPNVPGCSSGKPDGLAAVFACECDQPGVCNIGAPCPSDQSQPCDDGKKATCETTMWHSWNDNTCIPSNIGGLDPRADAMIAPETFQPTCPLTFKVVSRGTAMFKDIFGWYNATGVKPDASDLHVMLKCGDLTGASVILDIQNDAAYLGGKVGFFLATPESLTEPAKCAAGDCCATIDRVSKGEGRVFYSERPFNPDATGAQSNIHLLIYDSKVTPHKFYFAWEDLFGKGSGDFTDIVTSVMGVECAGGGLACELPAQKGMCKTGVTRCNAGAVECVQVIQSEAEKCDGVDNDCNDLIDDNAPCPKDQFCINGRCVGNCTMGEFPCKEALTQCDHGTGRCVAAECVGKNCPADQVCRAGQCVAPCEAVVCPQGQLCMNDACIDLCDGVTCAAPKTCRSGICFEGCGQCNGAACSIGLKCDTASGQCIDPSCALPCATGTHCVSGTCKDNCDGATCPGGQPCEQGRCVPTSTQTDGGGADGPVIGKDAGAAGSAGGVSDGGVGSDAGGSDSGAKGASYDPSGASDSGCGCRTNTTGTGFGWAAAIGALAILCRRRARRG
jgi:hypothetical protein